MDTRALGAVYDQVRHRHDRDVSDRDRSSGWYAALGRHERLLWAAVAVAFLGDVVSTVAGINYGLAEGNPVVGLALATGGVGGLLAVKCGAVAVGGLCRRLRPDAGPAIAVGLALPWVTASFANTVTLAVVVAV